MYLLNYVDLFCAGFVSTLPKLLNGSRLLDTLVLPVQNCTSGIFSIHLIIRPLIWEHPPTTVPILAGLRGWSLQPVLPMYSPPSPLSPVNYLLGSSIFAHILATCPNHVYLFLLITQPSSSCPFSLWLSSLVSYPPWDMQDPHQPSYSSRALLCLKTTQINLRVIDYLKM